MSGRYHDYDKGSSRSTRDDSRTHKDRRWEGRSRDRSRSPRRHHSPVASSRDTRHSPDRSSRSRDKEYEEKIRNTRTPQWEINSESEEDVPAPPPPPRISKITMGFTKPKAPIKMSLGGPTKSTAASKPTVASVFNEDDEDEPEQMPAEAKMRMRNIGRETPTSAGPNSFGKTKQGFCDAKKVFEKNLKQALDTADKPTMPKFPQTIYKISGP